MRSRRKGKRKWKHSGYFRCRQLVVKLKWEGKGELLMGKPIHVERKQIMNGK